MIKVVQVVRLPLFDGVIGRIVLESVQAWGKGSRSFSDWFAEDRVNIKAVLDTRNMLSAGSVQANDKSFDAIQR